MKKLHANKTVLITVLLAILAVVAVSALLITVAGDGGNTTKLQNQSTENANQQSNIATKEAVADGEAAAENDDYSTVDSLQYLIEEEKLAHDVYAYFYEKYGARMFNNIAASETTHQNRVLDLLVARDIPDPRLEAAGQFTNQELQNLYNQLIALGEASVTEAYKVGVIIEEKDIADLQAEIERTTDSEIKTVLSSLRNASEKHLQAFSRQL